MSRANRSITIPVSAYLEGDHLIHARASAVSEVIPVVTAVPLERPAGLTTNGKPNAKPAWYAWSRAVAGNVAPSGTGNPARSSKIRAHALVCSSHGRGHTGLSGLRVEEAQALSGPGALHQEEIRANRRVARPSRSASVSSSIDRTASAAPASG